MASDDDARHHREQELFREAERGMFAAQRALTALTRDLDAILKDRERAAESFVAFRTELAGDLRRLQEDVRRLLDLVRDGNGQEPLLMRMRELEDWRARLGESGARRFELWKVLVGAFASALFGGGLVGMIVRWKGGL